MDPLSDHSTTSEPKSTTPNYTAPHVSVPSPWSKKKSFFFGLFALILVGGLVGGAYLFGVNNAKPRADLGDIFPTTPPQTDDPTANWQTYTIDTVGLSFKLPPSLSKYAWEENLLPGEKGNNLCFEPVDKSAFLIKKAYAGGIGVCPSNVTDSPLVISGTSIDFEAGRGGGFTDYQGFTEKNGTYIANFVIGKSYEIRSDLVQKVPNENGVKIIKVTGESNKESPFPVAGTPGDGYIGALIQTNNTKHPGLVLQLKINSGVTENEFDLILSTFSFSSPNTTDTTSLPVTDTPVRSTIIAYAPNTSWQTYTDPQNRFTTQYPPTYKPNVTNAATGIDFLSCNTNPSDQKEICLGGYNITIHGNYDNGSRRVWLSKQLGNYTLYKPYYEEVIIQGKNSLLAMENNPGGSAGSFVVIPINASTVYLIGFPFGYSSENLTFIKQVLATFRFL